MKKLLLIAILMMVGACGMNRPFNPTISYINGTAATTAYSQQNGSYVMVYNLADAQLNWDVSNVPGAEGVKIIASRDYNCSVEVASSILYIVNSRQRSNVLYPNGSINPQENLQSVFYSSLKSFTMGRYYICVSAMKMGQFSPPSFPVTLELLQNQMFLKAEGAGSSDEEAVENNEQKLEKDKDPYFDARPENL